MHGESVLNILIIDGWSQNAVLLVEHASPLSVKVFRAAHQVLTIQTPNRICLTFGSYKNFTPFDDFRKVGEIFTRNLLSWVLTKLVAPEGFPTLFQTEPGEQISPHYFPPFPPFTCKEIGEFSLLFPHFSRGLNRGKKSREPLAQPGHRSRRYNQLADDGP